MARFRQINIPGILYHLYGVRRPKPEKQKEPGENILVVKTDALGDMILFIPFLKQIFQKHGASHVFVLCREGMEKWVTQWGNIPPSQVQTINPGLFKRNKKYRKEKMLDIFKWGYWKKVWVCNGTRDLYITETLIRFLSAEEIAGPVNDRVQLSAFWNLVTHKYYHRLVSREGMHETERMAHFLNVLDSGSGYVWQVLGSVERFEKEVIISPGAGAIFRKWPTARFVEVAQRIVLFGYSIVWMGSQEEKNWLESLAAQVPNSQVLAGGTPMAVQNKLRHANLFLGNDSGLFHAAVCQGVSAVCVSNGNHYGRFVPYPETMIKSPQVVVFPQGFMQLGDEEKVASTQIRSSWPIDLISTEEVIREVGFLLKAMP